MGADNYICKPFSLREMVARVRAVLRRLQLPVANAAVGQTLRLYSESSKVQYDEREIELTAVEFQLLYTLHQQPGRIFSRARLMDLIYQDQRIVSDRTIDSHIKKLRKKVVGLIPEKEVICSVYGAGYRYDPKAAEGMKF